MHSNFWKNFKKPARAGRPIMVMAPMSGVTDEPFRLMFLKYGKPDVFWTEFVSADGLVSPKGKKYCLNLLKFNKKERPIVAQIFGADPIQFEKAATIIEEIGFDGIDINMGCPDKDIEKKGGGAALINNPSLAKEIIRAVKRGTNLPISVKTRIGYNKNQITEWIPALLEENIAVLTVHFRTRKEMYLAPAHWELAKEIIKLRDDYAPETLILGNGDIKSLTEGHKLVKETGLDGVMFGRGLLGNPWFFSSKSPTIVEKAKAIVEHAEIFDNFHKEDVSKKNYYKKFASIKKHFHAYIKGFEGAKDLREQLMAVKDTAETKKVIKEFLK
jgi:nifR3 family TIM-barrel protein